MKEKNIRRYFMVCNHRFPLIRKEKRKIGTITAVISIDIRAEKNYIIYLNLLWGMEYDTP